MFMTVPEVGSVSSVGDGCVTSPGLVSGEVFPGVHRAMCGVYAVKASLPLGPPVPGTNYRSLGLLTPRLFGLELMTAWQRAGT